LNSRFLIIKQAYKKVMKATPAPMTSFLKMQQRKERDHKNLKKAVFQECVDRYGGKSETELFQSFAFV